MLFNEAVYAIFSGTPANFRESIDPVAVVLERVALEFLGGVATLDVLKSNL